MPQLLGLESRPPCCLNQEASVASSSFPEKIDSAETQDIATEITKHLPDPAARGNKAQNIPLPLLNSVAGQS